MLSFTIHNFKRNGITLSSLNFKTKGSSYHYDDNSTSDDRILVHYRVEDTNNINPLDGFIASTVWVDANSSFITTSTGFISGTNINSSNYFSNTDRVNFQSTTSYSFSGNDLIINVGSILFKKNNNSFLYFRLGLPTSANYSFSYISTSILL